mmetsp:Transcript_25654/g.51508  ORF Transcript_25654/g.51508 Transcript_25654/m.51508 type:complete len:127 (-) Transcript_25654:385-765(-)|eukprot:CAMPEP_0174723172 /NCGR_PEP_ID=MMETSP1094-20130205/40235_1 /TAXON_ID=156173 /ORGANISM="Chrysochromulina brevifilum, Strain UTEX LB 985" /LENGTH=126 /DNA_ID=CAMNT_0015924165 /DNA_START=148 /DNA_END=528 /DNA_ORIENTATION=-
MPLKTRDGWKSRRQLEKQAAAWKKAREKMIEKIGLNNLDDLSKVEQRAKEIFQEIDTDANGKIDQEELGRAMSNMGVKLTKSELSRMMYEADEDQDALIAPYEFIDLCKEEVKRYKNVTSQACSVM